MTEDLTRIYDRATFLFENKDLAEEIRQAVLLSKGMVNAKKALDTPLAAEETAEAVGSTPGAVRVAQHRALARLRKTMPEGSDLHA